MGAHNAIAVEAWQVVAQWDLQVAEDGTLNAVRYGTPEYDAEYTQPYAGLVSRVATSTASDAFAGQRISSADGLEQYYRDIGAYGDISPDDGSTATFTPAQPPAMPTCAGAPASTGTGAGPGLTRDCTALLDSMATLAGTATLDWNASTTISSWEGISLNPSSTRVTALDLNNEGLDGTIPPALGGLSALETLDLSDNALSSDIPSELGRLWDLRELRLSGNSLAGCIPLVLKAVPTSDLASLGLPYCEPPAPENLSAGTPGESSIVLSWDAVSGAAKYRVEHRSATSTEWAVHDDTLTITSHTVAGLTCGTEYGQRVRSYGDGVSYEAVWSLPSAVVSETTGECIPPVFGTLVYSFSVPEDAATSTLVGTVTATSTGGLVTYAILSGNEGDKFAMETSSGDITVADALDYETVPSYRLTVGASDARGGAATTTVEIAVTDVPDDPPPAPGGLSVSLAEDTFTIGWDAVTGAALYEAQHRVAGSGEDWAGVGTTTATLLTYSPEGDLTCGTTYEFRVRAYGDGAVYVPGWGEPSAADPVIYDSAYDACTQPPRFDEPGYTFTVAEDAPTGHLVGTVTATDPDEGDTVRYAITAGNDVGAFAMGESSGAITVAGALDHETAPTYSLTVEAGDGRGGTATTSVGIVVTNVIERPGAPRNLAATMDGPWVRLEWEAPQDSEVTGYQVLRRRTFGSEGFLVHEEDTGSTDTFYTDTSVSPETTYTYRVKAINTDGVGPQSHYVHITTGALAAPPAPAGLSASVSEGAFTVMWEALSGASLYEVERRVAGGDGGWSNATTTSETALTISPEEGVACETAYEFRVRAYGDGRLLTAVWGEYSGPATVRTVSCNPEFGAQSYSFLVLENASAGTAVGAVTATDPDEGDTVVYAVTSGNEGGEFAIGERSGQIRLSASIGSPAGTEYSLTVEASDGRGGRASVPVTVTVAAATCSGGIAVSDPPSNPGLVGDCETLLGLKAALAGAASLNWGVGRAMRSWNGVTVGGSRKRVTELNLRDRGLTGVIPPELGGLSNLNGLWLHENQLTGGIPAELSSLSNLEWLVVSGNGLTGEIPSELGGMPKLSQLLVQENRLSGELPRELGDLTSLIVLQMHDNLLSGPIPPELGSLSGLSVLNLSGNPLEGCLPPSWRGISANDFGSLSLPYCEREGRAPAPQDVSASLSGDTFTITWTAVSGGRLYEAQHRIEGSGAEWTSAATSTATLLTYSPEGGPACETSYELRVRAYGDGTTYAGGWGSASAAETVTTGECPQDPEFDEPFYSFTVSEGAATTALVGTVSATDPDEGDVVTYTITAGNEAGRFSVGRSSGEIAVASALDYETTQLYRLTVGASDGRGGSATVPVEISVTDVPEDPPAAPRGVIVSLSDGSFTIGWEPVTGAGLYEVQYRMGDTEDDWAVVGTTTATVLTYRPEGGPACGTTYELRVRAYGDGVTYAAAWGAASDAEPATTAACNRDPEFDEPFYSFSVPENATMTALVGTVSATDPDEGDVVTYAITSGNDEGRFSIGGGTGAIAVAGVLDHETTPSYMLTVEAGDGNGGTATVEVDIAVIEDSCSNGIAVPSPDDNPGLVGDCTVLLAIRDTLAGDAALDWSAFTAIGDWDGVRVSGTPARVTALTLWTRELSGSIPPELAQLSRLADLHLGGNSLTGDIPSELGELTGLRRLDLYSNRLTGTIPTELGGLTNLRTLSLTGNLLDGPIPAQLGGLSDLEVLYLGGNRLTGGIPTELGGLIELRSLLLHENLLTGPVPPEIGQLSDLQTMWLHRNRLSGEIPSELGGLTNLTDLYLGDNRLTGEIPSELGGLSSLSRLSLANNLLTGPLPWQLVELTNLESLLLHGNSLEGCIPPALRRVADSDLADLGLSDCAEEGPAPAPEDLSVSVTVDAFTVAWSAVAGAAHYEVQYRAGSSGEWDSVGTTTSAVLTYSPEGGPVCGTEYGFRVRSYGDAVTYAAGWGSASDAASATGLCMSTGLSALLDNASGSDRGIDLSWTAPVSSSAPVGYRVDRWARAKDGSLDLGWETLVSNTGSAATSYRDTGDNDGTAVGSFQLDLVDYSYRVRAVYANGAEGPWSDEVLAVLPQP